MLKVLAAPQPADVEGPTAIWASAWKPHRSQSTFTLLVVRSGSERLMTQVRVTGPREQVPEADLELVALPAARPIPRFLYECSVLYPDVPRSLNRGCTRGALAL